MIMTHPAVLLPMGAGCSFDNTPRAQRRSTGWVGLQVAGLRLGQARNTSCFLTCKKRVLAPVVRKILHF